MSACRDGDLETVNRLSTLVNVKDVRSKSVLAYSWSPLHFAARFVFHQHSSDPVSWNIHAVVCIHVRTLYSVCVCVCACTFMHIYRHAFMHACVHARVHMYVYPVSN